MTRRIGLIAATGIGVGSMIGAGVFSDMWVDVLAAGQWALPAVACAAVVALLNALSTAQLAARYPVAGGAYAYGRAELGPFAGHFAGAAFVVGKTVSVAVAALVLGTYLIPGHAPGIASAAIVAAWALNARGITRTAWAASLIAVITVTALGGIVVMALLASPAREGAVTGPVADDAGGPVFLVAVAAAFFAFAGYARVATLGEEVTQPARTIPRAVMAALAIVVVVYLAVGFALTRTESAALAQAPLEALARVGHVPVWTVTAVAALSVGGAMLAVMAGAGRTAMAMAREGDLPRALATQGESGAPWRAEAVVAAGALALVWSTDASLVLVSAASILTYYAVANVAAARQRRAGRTAGLRVPAAVPWVGLAASALLAVVALTQSADGWWTTAWVMAVVVGWPAAAAVVRSRRPTT
ncbi:APC family permease [Demequina sp. NBRC 110057]|uniref:APC family permease n=1 Tax=Demequina sp. NBRC 110057 TaxID=1570346 RepID=UPI000A0797A6|nr:APC family permease [Demequina sp. NBRC 110057]